MQYHSLRRNLHNRIPHFRNSGSGPAHLEAFLPDGLFVGGLVFLENAPGISASISFFTSSSVSLAASSAVGRVPSAFLGTEMTFLPNLMTGPQRAFSIEIFSPSHRWM